MPILFNNTLLAGFLIFGLSIIDAADSATVKSESQALW